MRYVDSSSLPELNIKCSVLGFGCSALLGRVGRKDSLKALSNALDSGITFFDTARSYGYGESERLLGEFLKGRRDEVVLSTKFGIVPAPRGGWKQKIKPLAQAAIRVFPKLRTFAQQRAADQSTFGQFSVQVLRESFDTSLRELQTDYVDILLMHAAPVSVLEKDDLLDQLSRLVEAGKVRMAGISGEHDVISETFQRRPQIITTAQFAVNCTSLEFTQETAQPQARELFLVANHPFGGPDGVAATFQKITKLRHSAVLNAELRNKLEIEDPQLMPEIILNVILSETGISAVIPAMMQEKNLKRNVLAIESCRFSSNELAELREALIRDYRTN